MRQVVRSLGVLSLAKIMGILYAALGFIAGCIFALISLLGGAIGSAAADSPEPFLGVIFGVGAIIFLPIMYGLLGFIGGLIMSGLYNLVAGWVGGLEVELEPTPGAGS